MSNISVCTASNPTVLTQEINMQEIPFSPKVVIFLAYVFVSICLIFMGIGYEIAKIIFG